MSEPTYTLTLTESERIAMAAALGTLVTKLTNCHIQIEAPAGGTQAARAILSPSTAPPAVAPKKSPAPIEQRDRWARDRKGNEVPNPEGCEAHTVHLWKAEIVKRKDASKTSFMKLAWDSPSSKGSVDASCFDANLFSYFLAALKQHQVTLYTVRNGNYLNVVGVRA